MKQCEQKVQLLLYCFISSVIDLIIYKQVYALSDVMFPVNANLYGEKKKKKKKKNTHLKRSYDKQNLTRVVILYDMYETSLRCI